MTPVQRDILARLRAGEWLLDIGGFHDECGTYRKKQYQFSGGGRVASRTFQALLNAKLIRGITIRFHSGDCGIETKWIATAKGDGDDT